MFEPFSLLRFESETVGFGDANLGDTDALERTAVGRAVVLRRADCLETPPWGVAGVGKLMLGRFPAGVGSLAFGLALDLFDLGVAFGVAEVFPVMSSRRRRRNLPLPNIRSS